MMKIETTDEFLARGGKIQYIPAGVTGLTGQEIGLFMRGEKAKARESIAGRIGQAAGARNEFVMRRFARQSREVERLANLA